MADNVTADAGSGGAVFATDDISSVHYPISKLAFGALDTANLVTSTATNPFPVALSDTDNTVLDNILTSVQLIDDAVYVDDADWTDSTSKHLLVGGLYQSSPQTVTDGDVAPFNITANGALHVSDGGGALTVDNAGTFAVQVDGAALTALQLIDDPVATLGTTTYSEATTKGMIVGAVRNDTLAALADTDNEIAPLQVNASGALFIQEGSALDVSGATVTVDLGANNDVTIDGSSIVLAEDAEHSSGAAGINPFR
jgi:hypothetical protein